MRSSLSRRERAWSAVLVAGLHGALGVVLLTGLGVSLSRTPDERLAVFDVPPSKPPVPPEPAPSPAIAPEPAGEAAPPELRATPVPVVAPPPIVRSPPPIPVIAVPVTAEGDQASVAQTPGTGTGAGETGTGLGAGGAGTGTGGGGGSPARLLRGEIRNADYPGAAVRVRAQGTVIVRLAVGPDGRVAACEVAESSGNGDLDATTCRLIARRFRYEPARDETGRAVPDRRGWRQTWWLDPR